MSRRRRWFNQNREFIKSQLGNKCANCESSDHLDIHHIVPLSLGGSNLLSNMAMLCAKCHGKAHAHDAWQQRRMAQLAGIERAKRRGVYRGRPTDTDLHQTISSLLSRGLSIRTIAETAGCSTSTVQKVKKIQV